MYMVQNPFTLQIFSASNANIILYDLIGHMYYTF